MVKVSLNGLPLPRIPRGETSRQGYELGEGLVIFFLDRLLPGGIASRHKERSNRHGPLPQIIPHYLQVRP
jgi:hypothetical protein